MNPVDLNGSLAVVGGVSGAAFLFYLAFSVYYSRQKAEAMRELARHAAESLSIEKDCQLRLAKLEGIALGGTK